MEFRDAPVEEQTRRLQDLARAALARWSLEDALLSLIKYRENAVFSVAAADGSRYVMRVHRPGYRSDAAIRSEAAWMAALEAEGVHTPAMVPAQDGDVVASASALGVPEPRQCDLLRWVEGAPLGSLEEGVGGADEALARTYRVLGALAARVHEHGVRWTRPEDFVRPSWDLEALVGDAPAFGRFEELEVIGSEQLALLLPARERVRERLAALGQEPAHWGLIHGDFLPENILVSADGPRLIDFDDCGTGWYGFELATAVWPLLTQPNFGVAVAAYVEGYRGARALPDESLEMLPTFLMARSLSYLGWPAGRPEMEEGQRFAAFLAELVTGLAERYLAGELLPPS